ncbi:MAG TPA: radical SAM family heme chaperone HemW [Chthoniobacterales bacterium]|nr:radical SAM family heme chaperone HemW [Chthoniobacterales bacterium]
MNKRANHNCTTVEAAVSAAAAVVAGVSPAAADTAASTGDVIRHVYVHIPFCARICPYCAFYKELLDRPQMQRFCAAILAELDRHLAVRAIVTSTIYFGGGTPTALTMAQLDFLLRGFHDRLDLSQVAEWTLEANPGSVSRRKAEMLRRLGVNRISLGVQSWNNQLLKLLGREHNARQAEESFRILRAAGFANINVDLMFALPGQTCAQWRATLEKTISLQPEHISTYCLTYEEDTDFFLRQSRGQYRADPDTEAELFEMTMSILEAAGYEHYEISNYARSNFSSVHNRAYWSGENYLGLGPSAFSTIAKERWQNVCDYRAYADRVFAAESPIESREDLSGEMIRTERIALSLRTRDGVTARLLEPFPNETREFVRLGLLRRSNGRFVLTRAGKSLADSVAEAFI